MCTASGYLHTSLNLISLPSAAAVLCTYGTDRHAAETPPTTSPTHLASPADKLVRTTPSAALCSTQRAMGGFITTHAASCLSVCRLISAKTEFEACDVKRLIYALYEVVLETSNDVEVQVRHTPTPPPPAEQSIDSSSYPLAASHCLTYRSTDRDNVVDRTLVSDPG
jgi:hypothetical protein